jgi:hypothetical protein
MRALRVVGIHEDGKSIVCEDPARHERFLLPADERLRAAARGDISRLGQIEIETESQMRPREIQARIRAGESVQQVATTAGVPEQRVERFAYPVLLERSRIAELAQQAHPVREDGPDVRTLGEVVAYAFGVRGQDYSQSEWDAWKGDDRKWVVALRWQTGRSDMGAHWSFSPGAHGGTVSVLDEQAEDLLDPNRAPRTLRAVAEHAAEAEAAADTPAVPAPAVPAEPEPTPAEPEPEQPALLDAPAADQTKPAAAAKPKSKKNHPAVPAWEDVLLGVRSQRG